MSSFSELVRTYEKACEEKDIPQETVMAYLVELSQRERYNLYLHFEEEMPEALQREFEAGMKRILEGEPMAHVVGYSWFYGYKMVVNGDVLIPRPETEELCAHVLARLDEHFGDKEVVNCADVGTGSGAIAITLVKEEPKIHMFATDVSKEALVVAKENAKLNDADITFYAGDMLQPLIEHNIKLDILVCNPPYIPQAEQMEKSVVDYEPNVALFGGEDGLKFYRIIFEHCKDVLQPEGFMAFEMGWNQKEALVNLVQSYLGDVKYEVLKDINGKYRMLFVYLTS